MATVTEPLTGRFPSPFEIETPPRAEGWRDMYPPYLLFSDENRASVPEIHLAQGIPTTVVLPLNVNETATRLADPQRLIYKPQFFKNTAVLYGAPFAANTKYRVRITGTHTGGALAKEWTFTVGAQ